ncbi:DEAD/DEAH box helicase [Dyadobacter jiangsuensis]|uniref:DEAD/DEAH box helicase domain-containing protein n=1 Tax=Dyadobacter jiangsuensis TaxID=1591085 RepID=A0A2P8G7X3_9BACT|nr:DEAD/DEAH box helicase [Dyadobacter jiangsuensis]PSL30084.1 DEAD/DEAH box helicase domain-containing protein [Dyadobacter jiangsuensis]
MLSLQQAIEIKESITSYLKATFTFRKKEVAGAFNTFIHHPTQGMFKGPYISLRLRFVKADADAVAQIPLTIKPTWPPYDHQVKSWTRLSTIEKKPEPTIVTTGTGSGKTESFLYPILDYCYQQQHRAGVKVIILYPMNALATDQAKRLAELIHEDERLRGKITAGLFIGEGNGPKGQFPKTMGENHIIEHRDTILDSPPDILLTNFKMLDYALMKHNYHKLWLGNFKDASLLQFLVLDELHTYDGAQGTDVANLIRRLKLKLEIPAEQLCAVGTSATIGSGPEAPQLLAEYASKVFGESVTTDAIITENRIDVASFFGEDDTLMDFMPLPHKLKDLVHHESEAFDNYLQAHIDIWQQDKKQLAQGLIQLKLVKDLVKVANKGKGTRPVEDIVRDLSIANENFRKLAQWDAANEYSPKERILESLLTLIAAAKDIDNPRSPFMYLQVQLWIRELSGVQYTLEQPASFTFRDQIAANSEIAALPPWYCRECNSSGWLGVKPDNRDVFSKDITEVYDKFFARHKNVYFLLPGNELNTEDILATGYVFDDFLQEKIHPVLLHIVAKDEEGFAIQAFRKLKDNKTEHICPCCNNSGTVAIIGTKIPTLSSIAVSQTLATDLDPATDQNRKVLAFTNSVQDAAHQAGFIEGRNYRFTLRASIQKVINELREPQRLDLLSEQFITYWKQHADETGTDPLSGYLYRFFPKDYVGKASPLDYFKAERYYPHFLKEFDTRIHWEVFAEFGFNSRIGRTLEKTGASSVYFDPERLAKAVELMKDWLTVNDISQTIHQDDLIRFTNLVLHRARNRGAIDHTFLQKFREDKLGLWDLNWQKDGRHFLNPKFGTRSRLPKLLTNHDSKTNLLDTTRAKTTNWFHAYFRKTFQQAKPDPNFVNEFFEQWTQALTNAQLLNKRSTSDQNFSYAIVADAIWVKKNVKEYRCSTCEDVIYTNDDDLLIAEGQCLSYRCTGKYSLEPAVSNNYYKAVYNRNRFPRVYAREHTGLLERRKRERLEIDFKQRTRFNATNTLIATSTLEMGIDIGTLNTAYNNSVPPLPSNFLQRVGRAGRSSGAALVVNFAKNQNHDLYYYTDPLEMMQGEVNTPGCYLEAKDILRRHFTAFCVDSWTSAQPNENAIPTFIRDLKLASRILSDASFFVNRLTHFIETNKVVLTNQFLKQYDNHIAEEVFTEVADALDSGRFCEQLVKVFERIKNEIHEIDKRRKELDDTAIILNLAKGDPALEELNREKKNLSGIKKGIAARNTLEHLTNVGVLPNYAFPETGVRLNAHVLSSQAEGSDNIALPKDFEIIRPASQAIKELAPENYFYTQGYRFEITGVNIFDWSEPINFHHKRFCSKCDHIELDSMAAKGSCPKCADPSWQAASNVHRYAKLTAVKSFNNAGSATLSDADDDREAQRYLMMNHVYLDNKTSEGAWILKDIPFGIEYVKNATITSVNYGRSDANDARKLRINDTEVLTKGFVTCKYCGKSSSATHLITVAKDFHYGYCKHKEIAYQAGQSEVFEEVYFFREVQTELLKIVLPIQEFNSEADIRMFEAGIDVGLKKYFKGNPGHIRILPYREFNHKTDKFDRFLLLYDTIPGGTGYLEQLFDHKEFSLLLQYGYEAIRDCSCQLTGKDGCYKCIYSYGNQYTRADLSRARAEKWFSQICNKTDAWILNKEGLTSITNSGKIEESELEERFIKLLTVFADKTTGVSFESKKQDGTVYYELRLKKGDIDALYWIRPQVALGTKDGIAYSTRTDFLIICGSYLVDSVQYKDEVSRIAIYLDGYQYHASETHNVFERDIEIRKAITKNPQYKSWTLTWQDLDEWQAVLGGDTTVKDQIFSLYKTYFAVKYTDKLLATVTDQQKVNYSQGHTNVMRLLTQLWHPIISIYQKSWFLYAASWTKKLVDPSFDPDKLNALLTGKLTTDSYLRDNKVKNFDGLVPVEELPHFDFALWKIWVNVYQQIIFNNLVVQKTGLVDKAQWECFWHIFNLFQSDNFVTAQDTDDYDAEANVDLFSEIKDYYHVALHTLIEQAIQKGWVTAENGAYLDSWMDEIGNVLADAELILVAPKIAIGPYSDESRNAFETAGFTIYTLEQLDDIKL